jgi:hypothetical protein
MEIEYRKDNPHNGANNILGTIVDGNHLIDLTQNAYINQGGTPAECWYEARAESRTRKDEYGEPVQYRVTWDIANPNTEDESEACDWDDFEIEEL